MDKTQIAVDLFNSFAERYQDKFMDQALYLDSHAIFCEKLQGTSPSVLDVACGPGNISRCLLNIRPDLNITGIDLAPNMLELAGLNNPGVEYLLWDMREITRLKRTFDGIICGFGLPYLSREDACQWIADAAAMLSPGGILYISTMEDDYDKSGWKGPSTGEAQSLFMHYHESGYLTEAFLQHEMEILAVDRKSYEGAHGEWVTDLIIIAQTTHV